MNKLTTDSNDEMAQILQEAGDESFKDDVNTNDDDLIFDEDVSDNDLSENDAVPTDDVVGEQEPEQTPIENDIEQEDEGFYKADKDGNLVDKQNKIVAKAGKERSTFVKMRDENKALRTQSDGMAGRLQEMARTGQELFDRYKALSEEKRYHTTVGLTDEEQRQSTDIMAQMKTDPRGALNKVLTIAQLNGIDLTDIGVTGPIDPQAVAQHVLDLQTQQQKIDEHQNPKTPDPQQSNAEREVDNFLQHNPDAYQHTALVAEAKNRYPHMTLDQIWSEIKKRAVPTANKKTKTKASRLPAKQQRKPVQHRKKGISTVAAHPSTSYSSIGDQLLADIKAYEEQNG